MKPREPKSGNGDGDGDGDGCERSAEIPRPPDLDVVRFRVGDDELALVSFSIPALRFPPQLSPVEREIAGLLCEGRSVAAIARRRGRSPFTVVNQVRSIYSKVGVNSHAELVHRLTVVSPESQ